MNRLADLPTAYVGVGWGRLVLNLLREGLSVLMLGRGGVDGVGHPVLLGLAKVVDQQVTGDRRDPGDKGAFGVVVAGQRAVHLDEDLLGEVFGIVPGSGEAVADVVDTTVVGLNDFLPGGGIAANTA